jgi:hypothetical protein
MPIVFSFVNFLRVFCRQRRAAQAQSPRRQVQPCDSVLCLQLGQVLIWSSF